ncbi:MAG TPA: heme exporter protein CcmB [Acidimicrobiales bacterium]|nr:heme exporter protein CcmB [Acidimicrobiales bacterium]
MVRDALHIARKDLRIEWRTRITAFQVIPFAVVVIVLFGFALGPDPARLENAAPGVFWLAVLLASVLGVERSIAIELREGAFDGLRLAGFDPAGIFLGKLVALSAQLVALEVLLGVITAIVFQVSLASFWLLAVASVVATLGIVAVGLLYGVLLASSRVRETLLPLLFFPVIAPVLIAGSKTWQAAISQHVSAGLGWLELLAVFGVVYCSIGIVSFGPLMEDL